MKAALLALALALTLCIPNVEAKGKSYSSSSSSKFASECPCSGSKLCSGPRGGTYSISQSGSKRYRK